MSFSQIVVQFFSILTLLGQILLVLSIGVAILKPVKITRIISDYKVMLVLIFSGIATFGSLVFSLILGFVPCELCWYQRIFMYPLVIISFVALLKNESAIAKYVAPLAVIGSLIAIYHVLLQIFPTILQCTDEVAKCSTKQFAFLGYITIPVMALTAFLLILMTLFIASKSK